MNYRKMIASLEAVVENETGVKTKPNVNSEIDNFDNVVSDECPINQDLDDLEMVNSALEAYQVLLKSAAINDILDRQVMLAVNRSLECFGLEPITNRFVSLEDYETISQLQRRVASEDFYDGVGKHLKTAGKMLAETFRKFIEWLKNFYNTWIADSTSKVDRLHKLKEIVQKTNDFKSVTIHNTRPLMFDGQCVLVDKRLFAESINAYEEVIDFTNYRALEILGLYLDEINEEMQKNKVYYVDDLNNETLIKINQLVVDKFSNDYNKMNKNLADADIIAGFDSVGNNRLIVEKRFISDFPYVKVSFEEDSNEEVLDEYTFEPEKTVMAFMLTELISTYDLFNNHRNKLKLIDRYKFLTMKGDSVKGRAYVAMIRGIVGNVTRVIGEFDRFAETVRQTIEKSIVK